MAHQPDPLDHLVWRYARRSYGGVALAVAFAVFFWFLDAWCATPFQGGWTNKLAYVCAVVALSLAWWRRRGAPRFSEETLGVLLDSYGSYEASRCVRSFHDQLSRRLEDLLLADVFEFKALPLPLSVQDLASAEKRREESKCVLLVWGEPGPGGGEPRLHFCFQIPYFGQSITAGAGRQGADASRQWTISAMRENDYVRASTLAAYGEDVVWYALASSFLCAGYLAEARDILESLHARLGSEGGRLVGDEHFATNVKGKIALSYFLEGYEVYKAKVLGRPAPREQGVLRQILGLIHKSLDWHPLSDASYLKTIVAFLLSDIKDIKRKAPACARPEPPTSGS